MTTLTHRGAVRRGAYAPPLTLLLSLIALCAQTSSAEVGASAAFSAEPSGTVTLREALASALVGHHELRAFSSEVRVREALALQAGLRPNPELRADVENVAGSGTREGFEETETTLRLSQLIELGGKRARRRHVAELSQKLASWDYEAKRLSVLTDTAKAFVSTLTAQERLLLAAELERIAREALSAVERSIEAGAVAPVEATRAKVALGRAELERARAERDLHAARNILAATWGGRTAVFDRVAGDLTELEPLPPGEHIVAVLGQNPDLARWEAEREERQAALALEEAKRIPDVSAGAGGRHFSDTEDNALVLELSVRLPVFDRNQGAIAAAQHRLEKVDSERAAAEVTAHAALAQTYERLATAYEQATAIRERLLPNARASFAGTMDAFKKGLLRPVDLLESQRTLFELRGEYLRALESFHLAAADIERLTGTSLAELSHGGAQ